MTRRAMFGPLLVGALSAACTCGRRADGACDDPSLWYAPDGGAGVYWGCTPPEGWTNTPPRGTADTAAVPVAPDLDDVGPLVVIPEPRDVDTGWVSTALTGATAMTGITGDTGLVDTGLPLDTAVPVETGATADTAPVDTVPPDTSVPPGDTAAAPTTEPALPAEEAAP